MSSDGDCRRNCRRSRDYDLSRTSPHQAAVSNPKMLPIGGLEHAYLAELLPPLVSFRHEMLLVVDIKIYKQADCHMPTSIFDKITKKI